MSVDLVTVLPRPPGFHTDLVYEELDDGRLRLARDLVYQVDFLWFSLGLTVKAGFICDGASVPRIAQWVISKTALAYAGFVHDAMFFYAFNKWVADAFFYLIARTKEQAGRIRGHFAWRAVQLGGWPAWLRHWRRRRRDDGG